MLRSIEIWTTVINFIILLVFAGYFSVSLFYRIKCLNNDLIDLFELGYSVLRKDLMRKCANWKSDSPGLYTRQTIYLLTKTAPYSSISVFRTSLTVDVRPPPATTSTTIENILNEFRWSPKQRGLGSLMIVAWEVSRTASRPAHFLAFKCDQLNGLQFTLLCTRRPPLMRRFNLAR